MKNKLAEKLTDAYQKSKDSIIAKILQLVSHEINELKVTFNRIENWRSIDNAEGKALDDKGLDIGQARNGLDDKDYRVLLKARRFRSLSSGTRNDIINVFSMIFNIDKSEVNIKESWEDKENPEPAQIEVSMANDSSLYRVDIEKDVLAAGVGMIYIYEIKSESDEIKFASTLQVGEVVTVYPYQETSLEIKGEVKVSIGEVSGYEEIKVYPKKE